MRRRKTYLAEALARREKAIISEKNAYSELQVAQEVHLGTLAELRMAHDQLALERSRHATLKAMNGNGRRRRYKKRGIGTPRRQVRRRRKRTETVGVIVSP